MNSRKFLKKENAHMMTFISAHVSPADALTMNDQATFSNLIIPGATYI